MRLEQLKYLVEIDRYKSMNLTSKHIHVTQQNLSNAMKQLENELQLVLFERTSKGVYLTGEGQYIARISQEILERVEAIETYAHEKVENRHSLPQLQGQIHVSISPYFARTHLPVLVSQFCERHPNVNVDMYVDSSLDILKKISLNQNSLGLVNISKNFIHQDYFDLDQINQFTLSIDKLIVLANHKSQIGQLKSVSLNRLLEYRLLFYKNDNTINDWLLETFLTYGQPKSIVRSNSTEFVIANLQDNTVLAPMASQAAKAFIKGPDIVKVPIRPKIDIMNLLVVNQQKQLTETESLFIDMLKQANL